MQRIRDASGQALLELAIFGSMMIVIFGAMINYAMNADLQQQTQMRTIRLAMNAAARDRRDNLPVDESFMRVEDGVIPDPSDPFAMGSLTTASYSASSPPRDFRMGFLPEKNNGLELPRQVVSVNGEIIDCESARVPYWRGCTTAGFWNVPYTYGFTWNEDRLVNNPENIRPIDKYDLIFTVSRIRVLKGSAVCPTPGDCRARLQILDSNGGEIVSKEGAAYTCRQLLDPNVCYRECLRTRKHPNEYPDMATPDQHCLDVCAQVLPAIPAYCQDQRPPRYLTQAFENLFTDIQEMGIQSATLSAHVTDTSLTKVETPQRITTTSQINTWTDGANRRFVYHNKGGAYVVTVGGRGQQPTPQPFHGVTGHTTIWDTPHE